jgi:hypothetical protein
MACQGMHSLVEFQQKYPSIYNAWHKKSNYLGFLSVKDEQSLLLLIEKLKIQNISYALFSEPDINNQVTAITIEPCEESKKLLSNIPRALKEYDQVLINKHNFVKT